ncbi:MAG: glycosyltransferase family protein, partial [Alphaproteobacteria bacterium]
MKVLRITAAPGHLKKFRKVHELHTKSFSDQVKILQEENLMLPGGWPDAMAAEGFEVMEVLYPDVALLSRWARENGHNRLALEPDPFKILKAMIATFKPDVIFLYAGVFFHLTRDFRDEIRDTAGHDIIFTGFWGDELCDQLYKYRAYFGDLDYVFVSSKEYKEFFDAEGIPSRIIGNAFDPSLKFIPAPVKDIDVLFCGTTGYGIPEHFNRYKILKEIIPKINIKIYGNDIHNRMRRFKIGIFKSAMCVPKILWKMALPLLKKRVGKFFFPGMDRIVAFYINAKNTGVGPWALMDLGLHPNIGIYDFYKPLRQLYPRAFTLPVLDGTEYLNLLSRAKIVLNIHRDELADVGNIRCFEALGVGTCLLTDRGERLSENFKPGKEIATFETADELVEQVNYLLSHDTEREAIAATGHRRCLESYTVAHRCKIIAEELRRLAKSRRPKVTQGTAPKILFAKYDTEGQPISYDISFFLQAAEIKRQQLQCDRLVVAVLPPKDIHNQPGVSDDVNTIVDGYSRRFRMAHILVQMTDLMPNVDVLHLKSRRIDPGTLNFGGSRMLTYPEKGIPHHSEYYKLVNAYPALVRGFEASKEAHRYILNWLAPIAKGREVVTVTLRQYKVNPERNNNLDAWAKFSKGLDVKKYCVVIIPDTDSVKEFRESPLRHYPMFEPACFDIDLRFALYERAYMNMFVNNGPCVAASLSKSIDYIMFKLVVPNTPTTAPEFIKMLG